MKINIQKASLKGVKDHTVIVPVYQQSGKPVLPKGAGHLKPLFDKLKKDKTFSGKFRQVSYVNYVKAGRCDHILFLGLGKQNDCKLTRLREALITASSYLRTRRVPSFTLHLSSICECEDADFAQAAVESLALPLYEYTKFKKGALNNSGVKSITIAIETAKELNPGKIGLEKAKKFIEACNLVRDLVNAPSNDLRTDQYAKIAEGVGKSAGLKVRVLKETDLKKGGFNALLSVNRGSVQPPRLVVLEYNGNKKGLETVCLVGKGITFDTGGISLKPSQGMHEMKMDMAGSATVLGIMQIIAKSKPNLHIVGLMPITDNMPGGEATVPGDIVKAYSGKTIEILNTDAEGRLILADALAYAEKLYKPKLMIDFATLTGACVIALGNAGAGIMGTDQKSMDRLKKLACRTGDKIWQLPLWDEYYDEFASDCADIKNIGTTRGAGASKAGAFLHAFINNTPWIHFDIAGSAYIPKATRRYAPKGATAACVRLVAEFLLSWNKEL